MMIQRFLLALAFLLVNAGFIHAKDPIMSGSKVVVIKSSAATTKALNSLKGSCEQDELEPRIDGTSLYQAENFNLTFSNEEHLDTTNFSVIEYYIRSLAPFAKKVGCDYKSLEIIEEMIEVL